jgi:hypothetical protein
MTFPLAIYGFYALSQENNADPTVWVWTSIFLSYLLVFHMHTHCLVDFCVEQVMFETPMGLNLWIMIIYVLFF